MSGRILDAWLFADGPCLVLIGGSSLRCLRRPIVAEAPISVIISAGKPLLEGPEKAPAMVNVTNANTTMLVYNMVTSTLYLQLMPLGPGTVTVTVPAGTMTDSYVSNRSKHD